MHSSQLITELERILSKDRLVTDVETLRPYECDGLSAYREMPVAVAIPSEISQISAILKFCMSHEIPVVARGAGTSLSGGAKPLKEGIVLSLARFNKILEIDPANRIARVQPGVRNISISEAAAPFGLYYAPDPSSQIACTIGGNVAENAGGVHCLKYGLTVHNVLKVDVVLANGEQISFGSTGLDWPGYDCLALLNGSEGLLGIVTEVTVRLLPKPTSAQVILAAFNDIGTAGNAVGSIIASGILPAGLEMMDNLAIRATEDFVACGYPIEAVSILLCELDGPLSDVTEQVEQVQRLLVSEGATEIRVSQSEDDRLRLWSGRKNAFPAV